LHDTNTSIPYVSRSTRVEKNYPQRENSKAHATFTERKLNECYERSATQKQVAAIRYKEGVYLEFSSAAKHDLAIKSLENRTQGIRLLNVKSDEETEIIRATVYIPAGKASVSIYVGFFPVWCILEYRFDYYCQDYTRTRRRDYHTGQHGVFDEHV